MDIKDEKRYFTLCPIFNYYILSIITINTSPLFNSTSKPMQSSGSFYIATGSADPFVYLYSIGEAGEPGSLVKKLEGHTDKVYAADINPIELTICSCSADSTLKIWSISQFRK